MTSGLFTKHPAPFRVDRPDARDPRNEFGGGQRPTAARPRLPARPASDEADLLDGSAGLDDLVTLSLEKVREILLVPLPKEVLTNLEHKDFASALALAKTQLAATERVLATQVRVDETRLRRRQVDVLPRLLQIIAEEKRLIEAEAVDASPLDGRDTPGLGSGGRDKAG
jgi:hypothetical protein